MVYADLLSPTEPPSLMNLSGVNDSVWGGVGGGGGVLVVSPTGNLVWVLYWCAGLTSRALANSSAVFHTTAQIPAATHSFSQLSHVCWIEPQAAWNSLASPPSAVTPPVFPKTEKKKKKSLTGRMMHQQVQRRNNDHCCLRCLSQQ